MGLAAIPEHVLRAIHENPQSYRDELDRAAGQGSLSDYSALMWKILEPRRALVRGPAWEILCEHLEAVGRREIRHLLINVPPGFSKSLLTNVFFPTYMWGPCERPDLRFLSFSYTPNLTIRDNRKARQLIRSEIYQHRWGDQFSILPDQDAKGRFDTNHTGWKIASSVNGVGMGERGDIVVLDDPNNVKTVESDTIRLDTQHFFSEVLPTRINDPELSAIIVIQQRTHAGDISGLILREDLNYEWLCLPMEHEIGRRCFTPVSRPGLKPMKVRRIKVQTEEIPRWIDAAEEIPNLVDRVGPVRELYSQDWRTEEGQLLAPKRFTRRHLDEDLKPALRAMGGTFAESAQLEQRPTPRGGGMFQRDDFNLIDVADLPPGLMAVRGYDLAGSVENTSPWSAGVKIAVEDGSVYILHADRVRAKPGAVVKWMQDYAERDGFEVEIDFPQDPGQAGKWQKGYLGGKFQGYLVHASPESGSKEARAMPLAAQAELGNVYIVRGSWNDTFIGEAAQFPRGDFKDLIDASSRAYARALKISKRMGDVPSGGQMIGG